MAITAVTTITIDGQSIALPGAYSTLDTAEAQQPGFDTGKVLAIVADTVGGQPQTIQSYSSLAAVRLGYLFSSLATGLESNAAEMARLAYNASNDDRVSGTFNRIVFVKPGQDVAATGVLAGTAGDLADLTAADWGAHTNQFGYQVGAGTTGGVSMLLVGGNVITQTGDDIGADPVLQVRYDGQADIMRVLADPDATTKWAMDFEHDESGLEGSEIVSGWTSAIATIVSSNTADTTNVTIYGTFGGAPVSETKALDGTTPVNTTTVFAAVTGVKIHGMTIGTVTVKDQIPLTVASFNPTVGPITAPSQLIEVVSSSTGDVGYPVQLAGKTATGTDIAETVYLNGTTTVSTTNSFAKLLTVKIIGTTAGTVTVQDAVPALLVSLTPGVDPSSGLDNTKGLFVFDPPLESTAALTYTQTLAGNSLVIRGTDTTGTAASELITGAGPSATTTLWSSIDHLELGTVAIAHSVTIYGRWIAFGEVTMDQLEAAVELQNGATVVSLIGDRTTAELDASSGIDVKGSLTDFYSQAQDVIDFINAGIVMTAVRKTGATGLPSITASTTLLTGGSTTAATNADITAALEVLKEDTDIRVIVPAYTTQSVHLLVKDWVDHRALPASKAEARAFIPLDPTTATKAAIKSLTIALNNERVIATVQRNSYYDDKGVLQTGDSLSMALTLAGLRSIASVGEPGTWKYVTAIGVTNDGAWTPKADADELVRSGLNIVEEVKGSGYRVVRSVTTYQKRADRIRTEESSMESADESARDLRTYTEGQITGQKNLLVTADTIRNLVEGRLEDQVSAGLITAWRNVSVSIVGDIATIDYEVAPVEPINFIQLQAHVFTVVQVAA